MVSRNKRIVAAFAAVAAMGMGLAGCGSDTAGDTKTTDDGGVVPEFPPIRCRRWKLC